MLKYFTMFFLFIMVIPAHARDLGIIGQTYPIKEMDIIEFIHNRLNQMQQNGELAKIKNHMLTTVKKRMERPEPVYGITVTKKYRSWLIDPTVKFEHDISDAEGKVVVKKGTVINPFKNITLKKAYLFYAGDDKNQTAWAIKKDKELQSKDKLILINGSIIEQSKIFKKRIYFDQHGRLVTKFKIKHTPAIVTQEGMQFKVEELIP
jgi:conjugal transfer pilus assembly protein TraW